MHHVIGFRYIRIRPALSEAVITTSWFTKYFYVSTCTVVGLTLAYTTQHVAQYSKLVHYSSYSLYSILCARALIARVSLEGSRRTKLIEKAFSRVQTEHSPTLMGASTVN